MRLKAKPGKRLGSGPAPLVLGDSVMWFAVEHLAELGFRADAKGCRLWPDGREMLERLEADGKLPRHVVMALGSNWKIPTYELERTVPLFGDGHTLYIVTPRERGGRGGADARRARRAAERWPGRVEVLDWVRYSAGKRRWFGTDGQHVTRPGRDAYVRCIKQALPRYRKEGHPCAPN